jgi:uncharacterized membrane protein YfcA
MPYFEVLLIATATFIGVLSQRLVGFGVPSFLVPVLLIYFSPPITILIFLLAATTSNFLTIFAHRDKREIVWSVVFRLFIAAVPGLLLGAFVVTHINKSLAQIAVGIFVIVGLSIQEFAFPKPTLPLQISRGINLSGFVAGFLNTSVGVSASALILWFRTHICTPNQVRHNLGVIFVLMNIVSFASIYVTKPQTITAKPFIVYAWLLPVILIGNFIGHLLAKRINPKQFQKTVFVAVVVAGSLSIILGAISLY